MAAEDLGKKYKSYWPSRELTMADQISESIILSLLFLVDMTKVPKPSRENMSHVEYFPKHACSNT